jgi:pyridoxamine 5'-phosphate oxidase
LVASFPLAPDFSRPLEVIHANHLRLEKRAALLLRLTEYLREAGCDEQARQTAGHILRSFDDTGINHYEDEELDLFPAMLEAVPYSRRPSMAALVDRLTEQHREMHRLWEALRLRLAAIAAGGGSALDKSACDLFHTLYLAHIEHEETEMIPLARRCLSATALERMGESMAARRNT